MYQRKLNIVSADPVPLFDPSTVHHFDLYFFEGFRSRMWYLTAYDADNKSLGVVANDYYKFFLQDKGERLLYQYPTAYLNVFTSKNKLKKTFFGQQCRDQEVQIPPTKARPVFDDLVGVH